jgi:hypothetical protein
VSILRKAFVEALERSAERFVVQLAAVHLEEMAGGCQRIPDADRAGGCRREILRKRELR